jgi:hypothetical protein
MFIAASFLTSFAFLIAALKIRKSKNMFSSVLSSGILVLSSILFSFFLLEIFFGYFKGNDHSRNIAKMPYYFHSYQTPPHIMVENSILYLLPSNHSYRTLGFPYKTNGMGFRERNFEFKKQKNVFRILVFGDSLTFGIAVANEQRYTFLLEEMLERHLKNSPHKQLSKIEVLNFGVPGYATDQEHDLIKAILKFVECDLIIVGLYNNDFNKTTKGILKSYSMHKSKNDLTFVNIPQFSNPDRNWNTLEKIKNSNAFSASWYSKSNLYNFLKNQMGIFSENEKPKLWDYVFNEFQGIKKLTKLHNLPPPWVVLLHTGFVDPNKNNFRNPRGHLANSIQVLNYAGKQLVAENFKVINPLPLFERHSFMTMAVSEWDHHPNFLAHFLYAQSIYEKFIKSNLLENFN